MVALVGKYNLNKYSTSLEVVDDMSNRLFQQAMKSAGGSSSSSTIATLNNHDTHSPRSKEERQIYVPRGRREMNEQKVKEGEGRKRDEERTRDRKEREEKVELERNLFRAVQERRRQAFLGDDSTDGRCSIHANRREEYFDPSRGDYSPASSSRSRSPIPDYRDIDDDKLTACCLLISGFPNDMSDRAKESEISSFIDAGAILKWLGPRDVVLIFINELAARKALSLTTRSKLVAPVLFTGSIYHDGQNLSCEFESCSCCDNFNAALTK